MPPDDVDLPDGDEAHDGSNGERTGPQQIASLQEVVDGKRNQQHNRCDAESLRRLAPKAGFVTKFFGKRCHR